VGNEYRATELARERVRELAEEVQDLKQQIESLGAQLRAEKARAALLESSARAAFYFGARIR